MPSCLHLLVLGLAATGGGSRGEVTTLATAVAEYPALVQGVVPITDDAHHPELELDGSPRETARHWVTEDGFAVDREACLWDEHGRPIAYRVSFPLEADASLTGGPPERRIALLSTEKAGAQSVRGWEELPAELPEVALVMTLTNGHAYGAPLLPAQLDDERGTWTQHGRGFTRLLPAGDGGGVLLGLHVFYEVRADGITLVTFRLTNGTCAADGSGASGPVYFRSLEVVTGEDAVVVWGASGGDHVDAGGRAPVVEARHGPYVLDSRRQTLRRFALVRPGLERRAERVLHGEGFARAEGACSYFEGGWGSREEPVPNFDRPPLRGAYSVRGARGWRGAEARGLSLFRKEIEHLFDGAPGQLPRARRFGLVNPAGSTIAGEAGGWLIESSPGAGIVARTWMRLQRVLAMRLAERQPTAFDRATGRPWTARDIAAAHDGVFPYELHGTGGYWYGRHELPWWREREAVGEERPVAWLGELERYAPIDEEHYVRAFTSAHAWALMTGDEAARALVREAAARIEHFWTVEPTPPVDETGQPKDWWRDLSLGTRLARAEEEPGRGLYSTRDLAWAIECVVAAYRMTPPEDTERRAQLERWMEAVARLVLLVQTPSGVCEARSARSDGAGGWKSNYSPDPFRNGIGPEWHVAQWLEENLRVNACAALIRHLHDDELAAELQDNIERTVATMLDSMKTLDRTSPPKWVAVQPGTPRVYHHAYGGESFQSQAALRTVRAPREVIYRMHGDGTAREYIREICRVSLTTAPDMFSHAAAVIADAVNR